MPRSIFSLSPDRPGNSERGSLVNVPREGYCNKMTAVYYTIHVYKKEKYSFQRYLYLLNFFILLFIIISSNSIPVAGQEIEENMVALRPTGRAAAVHESRKRHRQGTPDSAESNR